MECELTVIVACVEAAQSIERCLKALHDACDGISAQIIVVDASSDGSGDLVRKRWPSIDLRSFPPGTLVPRLWAAGLEGALGRVVAFTIGQVCVTPTWASAMVAGVVDDTALGGPLILSDRTQVKDCAVFYLRYSAMLPSQLPEGPVLGEIAGDNAGYTRSALSRHAASLSDGFWEVDFHRRMRAEGGSLRASPQAEAALIGSAPLWCLLRHRYAHGRHFAASRVADGMHVMRIVAAAPFVPLVLAFRAARRTFADLHHRRRFIVALPLFLLLAAAWAAGEAHGAVAEQLKSES
jgi:hypothetical protein